MSLNANIMYRERSDHRYGAAVPAWWVSFSNREPGCVVADDADEARCIAYEETGVIPHNVQCLPIPAAPDLTSRRPWMVSGPADLCVQPAVCAGDTHCEAQHDECPLHASLRPS